MSEENNQKLEIVIANSAAERIDGEGASSETKGFVIGDTHPELFLHFDWARAGFGFGQLSVCHMSDGTNGIYNECMSRETVRQILVAWAEHMAATAVLLEPGSAERKALRRAARKKNIYLDIERAAPADGAKHANRRHELMKPARGYQSTWLTPETLHNAPGAAFGFLKGKAGAQLDHPLGGPLCWVRCPHAGAVGVERVDYKWYWVIDGGATS